MCGKKTLAMLLAVITALSLTVIPVLADDGTGEELKAVILAVKSKIDIPDTYTEFVYSVNSDELGGRSWRLRWSQKDQPDRTISAVADEKGEITSYQKTSAGSPSFFRRTLPGKRRKPLQRNFSTVQTPPQESASFPFLSSPRWMPFW